MDWYELLRYAVFGAVAYCGVAAWGNWALRTHRLSPFGGVGRLMRSVSEPLVKPVEHRLVRAGANPQHATWWLVGGAVIGGLALLAGVQWLSSAASSFSVALRSGPRGVLSVILYWTYRILALALIIRVITSWLSVSPHHRWMRPVTWATEWMLRPLRRWIPPLGMIDVTPLVAWLVLAVLHSLAQGML